MTYTFKLSRRIARFRAPVFAALLIALTGCESANSFDPGPSNPTDPGPATDGPLTSASFAGGIPIGMAAQPLTAFNSRFNGAKLTIGSNQLMGDLPVIRSRGGKIVIMLAGNPRHYTDGSGHFSLTKWKARVDLFKNINFASYVSDGTIIGHYLMDEPNDPRNWNGQTVPPSMIEEMARYSKQLWPGLPTIVRTEPDYLGYNHKYLDAAWAAYLWRRGNVNDYIRKNVADAQARGLGLVVGMNVLRGGNPNGTKMTASEVEAWGSAMLSSTYSCAFLMWEHNSDFLSSAGMGSAMDALRRLAQNRSSRSCRGAASAGGGTPPPPPPPPPPRHRHRPSRQPACRSALTACPPPRWVRSPVRSAAPHRAVCSPALPRRARPAPGSSCASPAMTW